MAKCLSRQRCHSECRLNQGNITLDSDCIRCSTNWWFHASPLVLPSFTVSAHHCHWLLTDSVYSILRILQCLAGQIWWKQPLLRHIIYTSDIKQPYNIRPSPCVTQAPPRCTRKISLPYFARFPRWSRTDAKETFNYKVDKVEVFWCSSDLIVLMCPLPTNSRATIAPGVQHNLSMLNGTLNH